MVAEYYRKLEAALGDEPGFLSLYQLLVADTEMGKADAIALAKKFTGQTTKSKAAAYKKVRSRQQDLINARVKAESRGGRTAA